MMHILMASLLEGRMNRTVDKGVQVVPQSVCLDGVGEVMWLAGMKRGVLSHGATELMWWGCG